MQATSEKKVFGMPYNVGIGFLCVLGAVVLFEFYSNVLAGPSVPDAPKATVANSALPAPAIGQPGSLPGADKAPKRPVVTHGRNEEFSPKIHGKNPQDRLDTKDIDPTLRLDLLAKVQGVEPAGGTRNLFQMGAAPAATAEASLPKKPEPRIAFVGPVAPPPPPPPLTPVAPPVLPIQLKFYGYSTVRHNGQRTAYFMDGDDIMLAAEGELLKRRYKVIKIAATSVLMEDTESKRTQTLPLTEETPG